MKRLIISLTLLALLIGLGFWNTAQLNDTCSRVTALLEEAQASGEFGDWENAEARTRSAWQCWDEQSTYLYIVLPHDCTDEVYTDFHELLERIEWEDTSDYTAASSRLIALLEHLSQSAQLTLENLL